MALERNREQGVEAPAVAHHHALLVQHLGQADAVEVAPAREHQIRRLPVVEGERLVGIVSLGDLAVKDAHDRRSGDTLEKVSEGVKERG